MSLDDNGEAFYISFNLTDDKVIKNQYRASVSIKKINDQMILQIPR
jgi:heme oxygenase